MAYGKVPILEQQTKPVFRLFLEAGVIGLQRSMTLEFQLGFGPLRNTIQLELGTG